MNAASSLFAIPAKVGIQYFPLGCYFRGSGNPREGMGANFSS